MKIKIRYTNWESEPAIRETGVTPIMHYDPKNLSKTQREEVLKTLYDPVQSIFWAAKHISDLRNIDFKGKSGSELSSGDIQIIGARYNRGPELSLDRIKENLIYGKRITERWDMFTRLLSTKPVEVDYCSPIKKNITNPLMQRLNQVESSIYKLYGVPR